MITSEEGLERPQNGEDGLKDVKRRVWDGESFIEHMKEWEITVEDCIKVQEAIDGIKSLDVKSEDGLTKFGILLIQQIENITITMKKYIENVGMYAVVSRRMKVDNFVAVFEFNLICLDSHVVMGELGRLCCSIGMVSGSVSPIDPFVDDCGLENVEKLECMHVVPMHQVFSRIITRGLNGQDLIGGYKTKDDEWYPRNIGGVIKTIISKVDYGVLVFVASYELAKRFKIQWTSEGMWDELDNIKKIFIGN